LFFSTPCWNVRDCAANHVNEIKYEVLGAIFEMAGYQIENVYGTFASQKDYVGLMTPPVAQVYEKLQKYYDSNFLACVFAPMYPRQSRNALWELRKCCLPPIAGQTLTFPELSTIPEPWGSSKNWDAFKKTAL
jgi:hypothetical protein